AKGLLREMALVSTYRRPIGNLAATSVDANGARRSLRDALGSGFTLVAFASLSCAPSRGDLASLEQVRRGLSSSNVAVLTILEDAVPNAAAAREMAQLGYAGPLQFDDRAEASRALRQHGTPQYFLVENGVVRADARRAADLVSVVDALMPR
ncbi:MAG TPA: hypothetical protein VIP11_10430, partial [Gemmatimonadaceae bacterium]